MMAHQSQKLCGLAGDKDHEQELSHVLCCMQRGFMGQAVLWQHVGHKFFIHARYVHAEYLMEKKGVPTDDGGAGPTFNV